jgi:predicted RNA-binding Zn-ribbon protein involved in translation (DUF1610 family)
MSFLSSPRCPHCDSEIDLAGLWRASPKIASLYMKGRIGVVCPNCGAKSQVLSHFANLSAILALLFLVFVGVVAACAVPIGWSGSERGDRVLWVVAGLIALGGLAVQRSAAPGLLRLRALEPGDTVKFPLSKGPAPEVAAIKELPDDTRSSWVCPKCGEENPGNFDECWKCLGARSISGSRHKGVTDA